MKFSRLSLLLLIILSGFISAQDTSKLYYAIEMNDVICGYTESSEQKILISDKEYLQQKMDLFLLLSLFGSAFNTEMTTVTLTDPVSRRCDSSIIMITQGSIKQNIGLKVKDGKAYITSDQKQPVILNLSPDVLISSDEIYFKVRREFIENKVTELNMNTLELIDAEIQNSTLKKIGEEDIKLLDKTYHTVLIEQMNNKTGMKIKYWLAPELKDFAKLEILNRKVYLTDHTVVDRIKVVNMDASVLTKTNVSISDFQSITYMKLKVELEPTGIKLKTEDLNIPGQKFEGSIVGNNISGILEISYEKYSGDDAPPFPPDYTGNEALQNFVKPSAFIESGDPVLKAAAIQITMEAKNSWEAAKMLSKWVAENIHYAIPGGGTARGTYDMKAGECGGHSKLLASFCRAVGIPARVVYGGMYTPNRGGVFGQHAWNEVYMGKAGWIPLDATAFEIDYVDAGHIRISDLLSAASSFNARKIEILDYKLMAKSPEQAAAASKLFTPFFGNYKHPESGKVFKVLEKEGNLAVDIPGQMVLPFKEQDEEGRWFCKLTDRLYLKFEKGENDSIKQMIFHEMIHMPRQQDTAVPAVDVPEHFKVYLGNYYFAAVNLMVTVQYIENGLGIYDPKEKKVTKLQSPDEKGGWRDEFNKNVVYFEMDSSGKITALKLDAANKFVRE